MSITNCYLSVINNYKERFSEHVRIGLLMLLFSAPLLQADTLNVAVANAKGGTITMGSAGQQCRTQCASVLNNSKEVSLLAEADTGYRFRRWYGVCAGTLGPLCTLRLTKSGQAIAQFSKSPVSESPIKALLLLHGAEEKPAVWNKFAGRYFGQECPVIYGGVVLDPDSVNPLNGVFCYRIAFGYYQTVDAKTKSGLTVQASPANQEALNRQVNEITAAILGIKQRHPRISLTLVSAASVTSASLALLQHFARQFPEIFALLTLGAPAQQQSDTVFKAVNFDLPVLNLSASPGQVAKINAALAQITGSWWLAK